MIFPFPFQQCMSVTHVQFHTGPDPSESQLQDHLSLSSCKAWRPWSIILGDKELLAASLEEPLDAIIRSH
jgi:hypothetical protein